LTRDSNTRRSWHVRANGVVFGYALLGVIALVVPVSFGRHRWLIVHLFLLGSVTNCIVTWTEHFTVTLLRVPQPSRKSSAWRLVALNLAVIVTLIGVSANLSALIIVGAVLLMGVIVAHSYNLLRLSKRALQNRFAGTVRFYLAGAVCLILGIVFGALSAFQKDGSSSRDSLHAAHLHANLLGWIAVTVLGTFFTLWPTSLRTKMVDGVMRVANRSLPFLLIGISTAAIALAIDQRRLAILGMILYVIGMAFASLPFIRTWRQKAPYDLPTFAIAFSAIWLVVGVVTDMGALTLIAPLQNYVHWLDQFVPAFLIGFVAQLLLGALTFLVPVILGGGPASVRKHIERLAVFWRARLLIFNLGALFVIVEGVMAEIGYALLASSLAIFIGLIVSTVRAGVRRKNDTREVVG
jgi:nitrite reductase (NO-forming)